MTNEEATIQALKGHIQALQGHIEALNEIIENQDIVIKTLKQEPCEDCISRQYLLDNCVVDKVTMPYVPVNKIENAPPVNPQPKTGHWIDLDGKSAVCSCCYRNNTLYGDFCKWCGAKNN